MPDQGEGLEQGLVGEGVGDTEPLRGGVGSRKLLFAWEEMGGVLRRPCHHGRHCVTRTRGDAFIRD